MPHKVTTAGQASPPTISYSWLSQARGEKFTREEIPIGIFSSSVRSAATLDLLITEPRFFVWTHEATLPNKKFIARLGKHWAKIIGVRDALNPQNAAFFFVQTESTRRDYKFELREALECKHERRLFAFFWCCFKFNGKEERAKMLRGIKALSRYEKSISSLSWVILLGRPAGRRDADKIKAAAAAR